MSALSKEFKSLVRKSVETAPTSKPFYSPIDQAIANITQGKGTGQQMLAELLKTKGVAKELKDRPAIKKALEQPKITKQELERVAAEHPPAQIEESRSSGTFNQLEPTLPNDGSLELVKDPPTYSGNKYPYGVRDTKTGDIIGYGWDKGDAILDVYSGYPQFWGKHAQYEQYTIPGGENYREILLKLPSVETDKVAGLSPAQAAPLLFDGRRISQLTDEERNQVYDAVNRSTQDYVSSHWSERNILAHARVADRTGPNGEKILHVEEIQSDWHQAGRRKGYGTSEGVPDAPFKQNWHELVMKRLLDDAARNGYDKVVITPGAEQAKRYALSKHINDLQYDPQTKTLSAWDHSGHKVIDRRNTNEDQLADYIGKEGAEKLLAQNPQDTHVKQLFGIDLQVGGEGMKGFYDQILPSYLNDYGKPYGSRVGEYTMSEVATPLHSFDITPQMREDIIGKGLPLYQVAPVGIGAGAAMQGEQPEGYGAGGVVKKAVKAVSDLKGQQAILPAAESSANLERLLADSAIKDRVYHASRSPDIKSFYPWTHLGTKKAAEDRATQIMQTNPEGVTTYPAYALVKNPLRTEDLGMNQMGFWNLEKLIDNLDSKKVDFSKWSGGKKGLKSDYATDQDPLVVEDFLRRNGYDSIVYRNQMEDPGSDSYIIFNPKNIKSAIGNRGTYDIKEFDITKADGGLIEQGIVPKMLSTANRYLPLPTNARVYIDSVIDQRKDPITNKDFSESELDIIRDLVHASTKPHQLNKRVTLQPTPGYVNYETYSKPLTSEPTLFGTPYAPDASMTSMFEPKGRVATTLGQFTYGLTPEGHVQVNDTYNFNSFGAKNRPSRGTTYENYGPLDKAAAAIGTMGYLPARAYGQQMLPEGTGRQVNVVIPRERFGESYNDIAETIKNLQKNTKADGGVISSDEGEQLFRKRAQDLPNLMDSHERHKLQELLQRTRIQGGGGKNQYGIGAGGRVTHTVPLGNGMFVSPYIEGNVYKPVGQPAMGGVTGAGLNIGKTWKNGGSVSGDAMHMAVMDKQLRKKHGN